MGSANLDDLIPSLSFLRKRRMQTLQLRNQPMMNFTSSRNVNRRRKCVVGALPHVHMVVRVNRLDLRQSIAPKNLNGSVRDDFIDVHIARCSRTRLEHVDRKLIIHFAVNDVLASFTHRSHLLGCQRILSRTRQFPKRIVRCSTSQFHTPHRSNQRNRKWPSRNWEIFYCPLRLSAVVSMGGNKHFSHRIDFGTKFRHCWGPKGKKV